MERDCIKRNGDKTQVMQNTRYIVTSCHGNDDEIWSTSCLVMQHKPYIVEQPPPRPFKSYYHYTKVGYICLHFQSLGSDIQVAYFNQHMLFHSVGVMASIQGSLPVKVLLARMKCQEM